MLDRLFSFLPKHPPEWMVGFWAIFGAIFLLGLFLGRPPGDLAGQIAFWARLVVGLACFFIAVGLGWRRSHPS